MSGVALDDLGALERWNKLKKMAGLKWFKQKAQGRKKRERIEKKRQETFKMRVINKDRSRKLKLQAQYSLRIRLLVEEV